MSTKKKKPAAKKASKKAAPEAGSTPKPEAPEAAAEPAPEPEPELEPAVESEPAPEPEPVVFARDAATRSDDEAKAIRGLLKKAGKALETIEEVLGHFDPAPERPVKNAIKKLADELDSLAPPEPRKCKEYKRAIALARKGEMGIHPDDVMRFCRCEECHALREKAGVDHPLAPRQI